MNIVFGRMFRVFFIAICVLIAFCSFCEFEDLFLYKEQRMLVSMNERRNQAELKDADKIYTINESQSEYKDQIWSQSATPGEMLILLAPRFYQGSYLEKFCCLNAS